MIKTVIEHIERFEQSLSDFVETKDQMAHFNERQDLDRVHELILDRSQELGDQVLQSLSPYFQAGAWLTTNREGHSQLNALVVRGVYFAIPQSQWPVNISIPRSQGPLDIKEGPTRTVWRRLNLRSLAPSREARTFLFRPEAETSFIFATDKPTLWLSPHLEAALRLINKAFELL